MTRKSHHGFIPRRKQDPVSQAETAADLKHCVDRFSFVAQVFDSNEAAIVARKEGHRKLIVYHAHGNAPLT
jgi:hypothetical protein